MQEGARSAVPMFVPDPALHVNRHAAATAPPSAAPSTKAEPTTEQAAMARALFERFDTSDDRRLSQSALRDGLRSMGMDLDDTAFGSLWRRMTAEGYVRSTRALHIRISASVWPEVVCSQ